MEAKEELLDSLAQPHVRRSHLKVNRAKQRLFWIGMRSAFQKQLEEMVDVKLPA